MRSLTTLVDLRNAQNVVRGFGVWDLSNASDRHAISQHIDAELSLENLHCDGTISKANALQKFRFLSACASALTTLNSTIE